MWAFADKLIIISIIIILVTMSGMYLGLAVQQALNTHQGVGSSQCPTQLRATVSVLQVRIGGRRSPGLPRVPPPSAACKGHLSAGSCLLLLCVSEPDKPRAFPVLWCPCHGDGPMRL